MKALFLTPHSFLGFSGGTIATKNFLNIVRAVFNNNVTVVAEENSKQELLRAGLVNYQLIKPRNNLQKLFFLLRGESIDRFNPGFEWENLNIEQFTHLIIDNAILGRFAKIIKKKYPKIIVITLHHNFEKKFYADAHRLYIERIFINKVLDFNQREAIINSDLNLMFTKQDLLDIENAYGWIENHRKCIFGFFEPAKENPLKVSNRSGKQKLIITGNLSVKKGYVGIIRFINEIFIKLDKNRFDLIIAGKNPVKKLLALCNRINNIEIIANPKNIRTLIDDADIYLNPCSLGSGIKIRNFDGLRAGLPVICHKGNSYGFEHYSKNSFCTFDSINSFERALTIVNLDRDVIFNEYRNKNSIEAGIKKFSSLIHK